MSFSSGGQFVQRGIAFSAIGVESFIRNISVILFFECGPVVQEEISTFCFGCHFIQCSETVYAKKF